MRIKALIMDVDGTLTDGKIYMGEHGEVFKAFNIHDGLAINELLPEYGVVPVIVTGRNSKIVENRASELRIENVFQGIKDKARELRAVSDRLNIKFEEMAYMGDDIADLEAMKLCAIRGCPRDAVKPIIDICEYVSDIKAGDGALRGFVDWLIKNSYFEKE